MRDVDQLRELHDAYVWEVNAAVGEDRLDLVWRLADDYMDQALRLISADEPRGCDRPDCVVCARTVRAASTVVSRLAPLAPQPPGPIGWLRSRRRWWRRPARSGG